MTFNIPGLQMLRALLAYRGLVTSSIARELHGKYRASLFGALWSLLNPRAMMREALLALVQRESAHRLAQLAGTEPQLTNIPRHRPTA
jgi:ABC-type polysaccharide/polyol phosphate export permease